MAYVLKVSYPSDRSDCAESLKKITRLYGASEATVDGANTCVSLSYSYLKACNKVYNKLLDVEGISVTCEGFSASLFNLPKVEVRPPDTLPV